MTDQPPPDDFRDALQAIARAAGSGLDVDTIRATVEAAWQRHIKISGECYERGVDDTLDITVEHIRATVTDERQRHDAEQRLIKWSATARPERGYMPPATPAGTGPVDHEGE